MESKVLEPTCSGQEESSRKEIFHCETNDLAEESQKGYTSIEDEASRKEDKDRTPTLSGSDNDDNFSPQQSDNPDTEPKEMLNQSNSMNKVELQGEMDNQLEETVSISETDQPKQMLDQSKLLLSKEFKNSQHINSPDAIQETVGDSKVEENDNEMEDETIENDNNVENHVNGSDEIKQDSIKQTPDEPTIATRDADNQEEDRSSLLGRNRRVRQKNRYFEDFHCIDLIKGARTNKDDFDATSIPSSSGTRTSNRRSTTDSNRTSQDEIEALMSQKKYCRKCGSTTAHDDSGCQVCLFKSIVASNKRQQQKPSAKRDRSTNSKQQQPSRPESHESVSAAPKTSARLASVSSSKSKRKATKQGGGSTKHSNNTLIKSQDPVPTANNVCKDVKYDDSSVAIDSSLPINNNVNNNNVVHCNELVQNNTNHIKADSPKGEEILEASETNEVHDKESDRLLYVDSWTPDEVADYIMSKGFPLEAELFKTQSVDGISLLLMQRTDFTYGLKMKLGPALKIYDRVCKLKREYFKTVPISQK